MYRRRGLKKVKSRRITTKEQENRRVGKREKRRQRRKVERVGEEQIRGKSYQARMNGRVVVFF